MIISGRTLHMLPNEISLYFPNLPDTPFAFARNSFIIKVEDASQTVLGSMNLLTAMQQEHMTLKCQLQNSYQVFVVRSCSETVLCLLLSFPTNHISL